MSRRAALLVSTGRTRGTLVAARALADAGWDVGVGTPDGGGLASRSRSVARSHDVPRPRGDLDEFTTAIVAAEREGGYDVIFGGGDDWVAALAAQRDVFGATVAHPPLDVVRIGLDKVELGVHARAVGLDTPASSGADDADLAAWRGPVVVKCRSHWRPGVTYPYRVEARRFDDADAARSHVESVRELGYEPVLQEPIDGELVAVIGLFADGGLHGVVQQRATRTWPVPVGVSSRAITVDHDPELVARCEALLDRIGWDGLVELQFLRDDQGRTFLIDLNGRFYGSLGLALAAGSNLCDAWGRHALGDDVAGTLEPGRAGVRYVWLAGDLRRAAGSGRPVRELWSTARWLLSSDMPGLWRPTDPGPAMSIIAGKLRRRGRPDDEG